MPGMTNVVGLMEFLSKRVQITPNTHLFHVARRGVAVRHEFSSKHGCKLLRVFVLFIHRGGGGGRGRGSAVVSE